MLHTQSRLILIKASKVDVTLLDLKMRKQRLREVKNMLDVMKPSGEAEMQPVSSSKAHAVPTIVCAVRSVSSTRSKPMSVLSIAPGTMSNTVDFYQSTGQPRVRVGRDTHEQECQEAGTSGGHPRSCLPTGAWCRDTLRYHLNKSAIIAASSHAG